MKGLNPDIEKFESGELADDEQDEDACSGIYFVADNGTDFARHGECTGGSGAISRHRNRGERKYADG